MDETTAFKLNSGQLKITESYRPASDLINIEAPVTKKAQERFTPRVVREWRARRESCGAADTPKPLFKQGRRGIISARIDPGTKLNDTVRELNSDVSVSRTARQLKRLTNLGRMF